MGAALWMYLSGRTLKMAETDAYIPGCEWTSSGLNPEVFHTR